MSAARPKAGLVLRRATLSDAGPVWQCRQALLDSSAIQTSASDEPFETHVAWFSCAVNDSVRLFLIIEKDSNWLGYLRFDPQDTNDGYRVSIALHADARGSGMGRAALMDGCARAELAGFTPLFADISVTNQASRRIFEKCGFIPLGSEPSSEGFQRFMRERQSYP